MTKYADNSFHALKIGFANEMGAICQAYGVVSSQHCDRAVMRRGRRYSRGVLGEDGETHMGLYDIAYMLAVPGMTVTAPKDSTEMLGLLKAGVAHKSGPFCLRYPRDTAPDDAPRMSAPR